MNSGNLPSAATSRLCYQTSKAGPEAVADAYSGAGTFFVPGFLVGFKGLAGTGTALRPRPICIAKPLRLAA